MGSEENAQVESTAVKEEKVESDDEAAMEFEEDVYSRTQEGVSFDVNVGDPDMQRFWVSAEEYPEWMSCVRQRKKNKRWSAEINACRDRTCCLDCQSMHRAETARAENLHDGFVAASILLTKKKMNPCLTSS